MKQLKYITIMAFLLTATNGNAENVNRDSLSNNYKIDEEWYVQAQGGVNYMAAENTRFVNFWKMLSPQVSLSLGKYFTPVWGARLQLIMGKNKGVYYAHDANSPLYSFSHYGILGIGSFNITNFLYRNKSSYNPTFWNISALLGLGTLYTSFGFDKNISRANVIDLNNETYLSVFAGVEATRKISRNWEVSLELSSNWMSNKFNGQTSITNSKLNADGMINVLVGIRYILNRSKRKNKANVVTNSKEPSAQLFYQRHKDIRQNIIDETETKQIKRDDTYYSIENLLEMVDNEESIQGKKLSNAECVNFDFGKTTIKNFDTIYLDKVTELMKKSNIVLLIKGFIVDEKTVSHDHLTEQRMNTVRNYLLKHGIKRDRLVYQYIKGSKTTLNNKNKEQIVELGILPL